MKALKSILLIEDDKDDQDFFIEAISELENVSMYDIANNGQVALEMLDHPVAYPDFIFMDIDMPLMNGIECMCEMTKMPLVNKIPVIFLSSSTSFMEKVRSLGAIAFLEKQPDGIVLRNRIEEMINTVSLS